MCETRRNSRPVRDGPATGSDEAAAPRAPRQEQRRYKTSGGNDSRATGPNAVAGPSDGEFTTVRRRKPQGARPPRKEKVVAESA